MKKYKISCLLTGFLCCLIILTSLSCSKSNYAQQPSYRFRSETKIPDYSDLPYWAAHPWKKDLSDSVPADLKETYKPDSLADVFFIHPTTLTDYANESLNAVIDDASLNAKTDYSTILYQASVFNNKCRVFAPRYRQAHIRSFFTETTESEKAVRNCLC